MRYLVISDIHANLQALEAVLAAAAALAWDRLLVLGDLVGYGADPNAVIDRVRELAPAALIRGNHDKVGSGIEGADAFNTVARHAIRWTTEALTLENRTWLASLPPGPLVIDKTVEICHGAPFDEDAYLFDDLDARRALQATCRPVCLFGHTHVQVGYRLRDRHLALATATAVRPLEVVFERDTQYLLNPGSVGQPRDGDPRAAFGIYDGRSGRLAMHRVPYAVGEAQARILGAGLPELLAERLARGR